MNGLVIKCFLIPQRLYSISRRPHRERERMRESERGPLSIWNALVESLRRARAHPSPQWGTIQPLSLSLSHKRGKRNHPLLHNASAPLIPPMRCMYARKRSNWDGRYGRITFFLSPFAPSLQSAHTHLANRQIHPLGILYVYFAS